MEEFYTISNNSEAEIIEKKSKFIAHIFYVESIEEAEKYLKATRKKYHDARHNCFAYAIETIDGGIAVKYNDDGEPAGTAGSPILKILLEKGITNVLVVVTRYFGGILLGTGGLVRAYTKTTLEALNKVEIIKKEKGCEIELEIEYCDLESAKKYLYDIGVKSIKVEFLEKVKLNAEIPKNMLKYIETEDVKKNFKILKYNILEEKII
ncbi:MAG: IMPACT family protein [Clostridia bacterium]